MSDTFSYLTTRFCVWISDTCK